MSLSSSTIPVPPSGWPAMHATAVHVLPDMLRYLGVAEDDLDDLCQDVLLGAYRSFPRYDPMRSSSARAIAPPGPAGVPASAAASEQADVAADSAPSDTPPRPHPAPAPDPSRPQPLGKNWRAESSWLFGIAWRKVRRHLERAYRRREVPVGLADAACFQQVDTAPSSEEHLVTRQRFALAVRLLSEIAPERRAVLILADAYDIPVREIARALDINENTAASRLRLARRDYRAAEKRLRPEEKRALRSSALMLPLFGATSLRSLTEARLSASAPAAPGFRARFDGSRWRARLERLARPFARHLRPALGWGAAGVAVGVLWGAGLAPTPVAWARHLAPVAIPLLLARSAPPTPAPEPQPRGDLGAAPRSNDPDGPRASAAPAADGPGQRRSAAARRAPAPVTPGEGRLDEELALLDAAKEALSHGERAVALEHIEAHARRFPQSWLTLLRERLRSRAKALPVTTAGGTAEHDRP